VPIGSHERFLMNTRTMMILGALAVLASLTTVSVLTWGAMHRHDVAAAPASRIERVGTDTLREYPDLQRHFASMSYDQGFAEGGRLTQLGLARLPDDELLDYARRRLRLLSTSDAVCVALTGGGDANDVMRALEAMSDDDLRAWIHLSTHAQALELAGGPRPMSAERASALTEAGLSRIETMLSPEDAQRWHEARGGASAVDGCFVEQRALIAITEMPAADGTELERALLEGAAQPVP